MLSSFLAKERFRWFFIDCKVLVYFKVLSLLFAGDVIFIWLSIGYVFSLELNFLLSLILKAAFLRLCDI